MANHALLPSGRPKSRVTKVKEAAAEGARENGMLPHEWLLEVSRGKPVQHKIGTRDAKTGKVIYESVTIYPDFETRIDAAKAAAPYFAPRLATQNVNMKGSFGVGVLDPSSLKNMSTTELDNMITLIGKALGSIGENLI